MGFKATTHEPCLYYKHDAVDGLVLICRQVDDFAVAGKDPMVIDKVREAIQSRTTFPLNQLGVI